MTVGLTTKIFGNSDFRLEFLNLLTLGRKVVCVVGQKEKQKFKTKRPESCVSDFVRLRAESCFLAVGQEKD
jgi:hypothetical protein